MEDYSHEELGGVSGYPDILIKVLSTEEIAAIMKYAYEQEISGCGERIRNRSGWCSSCY